MIRDDGQPTPNCAIRTITAGVTLEDVLDPRPIETALALLSRARATFEQAGFQVQSVRIATTPVIAGSSEAKRASALRALRLLDQQLQEQGSSAGIGPCSQTGLYDPGLASWIAELLCSTTRIRCSIRVAAVDTGVDYASARMAAETMVNVASATPEGGGNFHFAAAACIPPGTPFYPVAYHQGRDAFSIGVESAALVEQALANAVDGHAAAARLRETLGPALMRVERIATMFAKLEGCEYLGIDSSPAPALHCSIGAAVEAFTRQPFGETGTVEACAIITAALRTLDVKTCGYSGLMLPVLEDPVLARRASEGHFGLRDLLLFSSVCGAGLDVVPLAGDTPVDVVERIIRDTAALASRWRKPLSTRLHLVPGKSAGEMVEFSNPELTQCRVMSA